MKILWVATKPPWPLRDGGRVLLYHTLAALAALGVDLTLVAPADSGSEPAVVARTLRSICRPFLVARPARSRIRTFSSALFEGAPISIVQHRNAAGREQVNHLLAQEAFDLVHAEQLQALANCELAQVARIPLVFRAQNVESDLWRQLANFRPLLRPLLAREARRLRIWEGKAVRRCDATLALTRPDGARLSALAGGSGKLHIVAAPFPLELAPGKSALPGAPAVVLFGSSGWAPNSDASAWFIRRIWPSIFTRMPNARLHLFGDARASESRPDVVAHPAPSDSSEAFASNSVLVAPLRIASGVRIKILEAWARGIPVIASPEAAAGLEATDGGELMVAHDAGEFADAVARLHEETGLRDAMIARARALLRRDHDPAAVAAQMLALFENVIATHKAPGRLGCD